VLQARLAWRGAELADRLDVLRPTIRLDVEWRRDLASPWNRSLARRRLPACARIAMRLAAGFAG
jgi:hypothetical protein